MDKWKDDNAGPSHVHFFHGTTGVTLHHSHPLKMFTYPVNGNGLDGHVHQFQGLTDYSLQGSKRHLHRFLKETGPAIVLPDGSHYHEIQANVEDEPFIHMGGFLKTIFAIERHVHTIYGPTSIQIFSEDGYAGAGYFPSLPDP